MTGPGDAPRPLAGYRVLDLGARVGSALAAKLLGELGADVVRVEPPDGDELRSLPPLVAGDEGPVSAVHLFVNAGKRTVALDVDTSAGLQGLRQLLSRADLVINGLGLARSRRLGLTEEGLAALNARALLVDVTSFGEDGPYRDFVGDGPLLFALGGVMNATGEPDREPLSPWGYVAEYQLGVNTAIAALAALYGREAHGVTQAAGISGLTIASTLIENSIPLYAMTGRIRGRAGTGYYAAGGVLDIFPCADGFIILAAVTETQWQGVCLAIGKAAWLEDPAWYGWANRGRRLAEVKEAVRRDFAGRTRRELFETLQALRVPCAPGYSPCDILNDPAHRERGYFAGVEQCGLGPTTIPRTPWLIDGERGPVAPAPGVPGDALAALLAGRDAGGGPAGSDGSPSVAPPAGVAGPRVAPPGVLSDVRILDFTTAWAGPLATQILADLGAQVIKVESPDYPDVFRMSELASTGHADLFEWGPFYHSANRNKTSISVDARHEAGREVLRELAAVSDVVIDNFSARVMRGWGLDHRTLLAVNPRIIAVSEPAFGLRGPYENYICYGEPIEAAAGLPMLNGYRGEGPMRTGLAMIDAGAAFHAALLVLATLIERRRTGRGRSIELSQFEVGCRLIGEELIAAGHGSATPERRGNRDPRHAPQGCYPCAGEDQWLMVSVRTDAQWRALAALVGEGLADDAPLLTAAGRLAAHDRIDAAIAAWTRGRTKYGAMHACQAAGVPAVAVLKPPDVIADPHLLATGFIARIEHPVTGTDTIPGPSFRLSKLSPRVASPAPRFGEHTDAVLRGLLGMAPGRIAALRDDGTVGRLPRIDAAVASTT